MSKQNKKVYLKFNEKSWADDDERDEEETVAVREAIDIGGFNKFEVTVCCCLLLILFKPETPLIDHILVKLLLLEDAE